MEGLHPSPQSPAARPPPRGDSGFPRANGTKRRRECFLSPPELAPLRFKLAGLLARGGPDTLLKWQRTPSDRSCFLGALSKDQPILSSLGTVYWSRSFKVPRFVTYLLAILLLFSIYARDCARNKTNFKVVICITI